MPIAVRVAVLAGLLLLPIGHPAAQAVRDTAGLQFFGFRAGARLDELNRHLRRLGGTSLRCRRARTDASVMECRGGLRNPELGPAVELWLSAIDSSAGVMTLSARVDSIHLDAWQRRLRDRYGPVGVKVQGNQSMRQWVRQGRMIRLTWRVEKQEQIASVSLVDGHVLDGWGRTRSRRATDEAQPRSRTR